MDLKIVKLLLGYPKDSTRYIAGVEGFVEFAFKDKPEDTKIYCPCHTCVHTSLLSRDEIYEHLVCNGILENYEEWDFHSDPSVHHNVDQQPQSQNEERHDNMNQLLHDAFSHMYEDIPMTDASNIPNPPISGPNLEAQEFFKLVEDSKKPLWTRCELTQLSLLVLLFNTKIDDETMAPQNIATENSSPNSSVVLGLKFGANIFGEKYSVNMDKFTSAGLSSNIFFRGVHFHKNREEKKLRKYISNGSILEGGCGMTSCKPD